MNWFTSDHHFGHRAVIDYSERPFPGVPEMDETLIKNWKAAVGGDDLVYVVGDFSFHKNERTREIFFSLPGKKILIQGNHDGDTTRKLFRPYVFQEVKLFIAKRSVKLSHYPYRGDHTGEERYLERRPEDRGDWLIHGHVHNAWKVRDRMICVAVENWAYKPVPITEIEKIIQNPSTTPEEPDTNS